MGKKVQIGQESEKDIPSKKVYLWQEDLEFEGKVLCDVYKEEIEWTKSQN